MCFETFLQRYCRTFLKAKLVRLHTAPGRKFGEERLFERSCGVAYCRCILSWESFEKVFAFFSRYPKSVLNGLLAVNNAPITRHASWLTHIHIGCCSFLHKKVSVQHTFRSLLQFILLYFYASSSGFKAFKIKQKDKCILTQSQRETLV